MKPIVTGTFAALAALSMTANALMYLRYSSSRPVVTVGSQVITKKDYQDALDYQTQGAVLKKLVLADLINQAATKAGVMPTDADVDARVAQIRRKNPAELAASDQDPGRMAALRQDLRTQIALENLQMQGVTVTDADVASFYAAHKDLFKLPQQVKTTLVLAESSVDASSAASLLRQNIAPDVIARQPRLQVVGMNGCQINWNAVPAVMNTKISAVVLHMKPGDTETIRLGKDYLVVRAMKSDQAGVPPLDQIRPAVTRLTQLEKGTPSWAEVAKLYQTMRPQFAVTKYAAYFSDLSDTRLASSGKPAQTASIQ